MFEEDQDMASDPSIPRPQRVPKRKASVYADALFETQKQQLARNLVNLRIRQGLSQEALAYEAEVERSYVSLIERKQSNPSLRVLCQLAQRLGVSVTDLLQTDLQDSYDLGVASLSNLYLVQEARPEEDGFAEKPLATGSAKTRT